MPELQNNIEQKRAELITKAKKDGKIDQKDILALIPETPDNMEALDSLYAELSEAGVEITHQVPEPSIEDFDDEWVPEDGEDIVLDDKVYLEDIADDSVRLYLREIGKIPLLSSDEELELAQQVVVNRPQIEELTEKSDELKGFLARSESNDMQTEKYSAELQEIETRLRILCKPKDKMAEANMRLVVSIAKRYVGRGLDLLDLIQEGNTGLLRAVEKFDPDKGFKFSTYATWWIRQAITRAIADQARTIRIPVHMVETINKLLRTQRRLTQELNREPTNQEIAKEMDLDVDKIEHIMKIKQDISSLDANVHDDEEDSVLGDFIEDEDMVTPEESASGQLLKEQIKDLLGSLTDREQKILRLRFGLEDGKSHTLEEVGAEFAVTRERIRQIEAKALAKLRKHKEAKKLLDYLK